MRIFENPNFAFVQNRKKAYVFSLAVTLLGFVSMATRGFEWGIDFTGGQEFVVQTANPVDVAAARNALEGVLPGAPEVKRYGDDLLVRTDAPGEAPAVGAQIVERLNAAVPNAGARLGGYDVIAPRFASDLQRSALYAVLASVLVIFVYVLVRFEWTWGIGAVVSLVHDVLFTLSILSLFHGWLPFSLAIDQTIVAALLTIVGYSINDTVVVYDRIREDRRADKLAPADDVANRAMNETLSRTILTGGATLLALFIVFVFSGESVRGFAFTMFIGILLGTYSSIFIATPVMLDLLRWLGKGKAPAAKVRPAVARG